MDIPGIRHRIIKHLPAYLLKYGKVDLAGLGRFRLDAHTSTIDYTTSQVYPPYYDVIFEDAKYTHANEYIAYLSKRLGLDDSLIAEVMVNYTTSLRQHLTQEESVALEGLGRIQPLSDNQLVFESDSAYWGRSAVSDLAISFEPVPRLKEMAEKQPLSTIESDLIVDDKMKGEEDFTELREDLLESDWDENVVDVEMTPIEEDIALDEEIDRDPEVEPHAKPIVAAVPPTQEFQADNTFQSTPFIEEGLDIHEKDSRRHRLILPLMILLLLVAVPLFWYLIRDHNNQNAATENGITTEVPQERLNRSPDKIGEKISGIPETSENEETNPSIEEEVELEKDIDEDQIADTDSEISETDEKQTEIINDKVLNNSDKVNSNSSITSGSCVIVVGAFGQGPNMRKMMSKLESKGFQVYVDSTRALSRVGVYSACEQAKLQQNLAIIQSDIEPASWVLNR